MCYSLPEALWLHAMGTSDDLLVAYPTVDRQALRTLAADDIARQQITIMVDSTAHLDVVDRALGDGSSGDPGLPGTRRLLAPAGRPAAGPHRHLALSRARPEQAAGFAAAISGRPGFRLVGVMGYEGQIAGLGDAPPGHPVRAQLIRFIQARSVARAQPAPGRGDPPDPGGDQPGVRERRRYGQPGVDRRGRVGDRTHGGLGPGRADAVRRVHQVHPGAGAAVRAARGPAAGPGHRHVVRRRLRRLGHRERRTGCRGRTCPPGSA